MLNASNCVRKIGLIEHAGRACEARSLFPSPCCATGDSCSRLPRPKLRHRFVSGFQIQDEGEGQLTVLGFGLKTPAITDENFSSVSDQITLRSVPNIYPKLAFGACTLESLPEPPNLYPSGQHIRNDLEEEHVAEGV
jgi:hypothetical protein